MNDRITKLLLLLIAVGLLANAAAQFYQVLVPNAQAAENRLYIEGGKLEVTLDRPIEIRTAYDGLPVKVNGQVSIQGSGIATQPLRVEVEQR